MIEILKEKFNIIRKIGQGGMAHIYLAKYKGSNSEVAIKILSPDNNKSRADKQRFKSEMELTQLVNSPYVVKILEAVWEDNIQYIVMEYIPGYILKDYISRRSRLTVDEAVDFARQIALGLAEIHKTGIIHRDIKSSNIMITSNGQAKIVDFGIAITDSSERLTRTDNVIGSVHYIAPEILEQKPLNLSSDIYALGILLFEMLTGDVPFKENDAVKTALKHKNSSVPPVNKVFENIPQAVANVVAKATAKDPEKRHISAFSLFKDLDTALDMSRMHEKSLDLSAKPKKSFKYFINSKLTLVGTTMFFIMGLVGTLIYLLLEMKK